MHLHYATAVTWLPTGMSTSRASDLYQETVNSSSQQADAGASPANVTALNVAKRCSSASCHTAQRCRTARASAGTKDRTVTSVRRSVLHHKSSHEEFRIGVIHVANSVHKHTSNLAQVIPVSSEKNSRRYKRNSSASYGSSWGLSRAPLGRYLSRLYGVPRFASVMPTWRCRFV